jgi:hypothetical protein
LAGRQRPGRQATCGSSLSSPEAPRQTRRADRQPAGQKSASQCRAAARLARGKFHLGGPPGGGSPDRRGAAPSEESGSSACRVERKSRTCVLEKARAAYRRTQRGLIPAP